MTLTTEQKTAVVTPAARRVVSAAAGTGKTQTVAAWARYLLDVKRILGETIAVLTFTRNAADEMHERIARMCGSKHGVTVCTLHSFCYKLAQRWGECYGLREGFTVYDEDDAHDVLTDLVYLTGVRIKRQQFDAVLEARDQRGNKAAEDVALELGEDACKLWNEYRQELRHNNAIDFAGLQADTYDLLNTAGSFADEQKRRTRHVIVDEAQDITELQARIIWALAGDTLAMVGDEDQSIYGWRGGSADAMNLEVVAHGAQVFRLKGSQRCAREIARRAELLIRHNWPDGVREFKTVRAEKGAMTVYAHGGDLEEAAGVCAAVQKQGESTHWNNIAVLSRTRARLLRTVAALRLAGVPVQHVGETADTMRTAGGKLVKAYLSLSVNADDNLAFLRARKALGVDNDKYMALRMDAAKLGKGRFAVFMDAEARAGLFGVVQAGRVLHHAVVHKVLDAIPEKERTAEVVAAIRCVEGIADYLHTNRPQDVLDWLQRRELQEDDTLGDGVRCMTIHAAKGAEFEHVHVVGMEEGHLPHKRNVDEKEERRLCYVAVTRARETVSLSWCERVYHRYTVTETARSKFVEELGFAQGGSR